MSSTTDQLPPHCPESERAALGCALQDPAIAPELILEWFYDLRARTVAETIQSLSQDGQPVSIGTVAQRLVADSLRPGQPPLSFGDVLALVNQCDGACHSPSNFPFWKNILAEKLTLRKVIGSAQLAIIAASRPNANATAVLSEYERTSLAIGSAGISADSGDVNLGAVLQELRESYDRASLGQHTGILTGFDNLDRIHKGLQPQQLVILAARPGVGKSALATNIAEHVAIVQRLPVAIASLEMAGTELLNRITTSLARVDGQALKSRDIGEPVMSAVTAAHAKILRAPIHLNERGGLTIAQVTVWARRMVQRHGAKLILVDYLGLMRSGEKGRSRYEETTTVSNSLKAPAKELKVPVVVLAQLNRNAAQEGRKPTMADLRDSGSVEQDADIIWLLHNRPTEEGQPISDDVDLIIAKNRSGPTATLGFKFIRRFSRFEPVRIMPDTSDLPAINVHSTTQPALPYSDS